MAEAPPPPAEELRPLPPLPPLKPTRTDPPTPPAPAPVEGESILDNLDETARLPDRAPGQTVMLDDLVRDYRAQCGANGTRERLLAGLDRAIRNETDPGRREIRRRQRERVAAAGGEVCPLPEPKPAEKVGVLPGYGGAAATTQQTADTAMRIAANGLAEAAGGNPDVQIYLDAAHRAADVGLDREAEARLDDAKRSEMNSLRPMSPVQRAELDALRERLHNDQVGDAVFRALSVRLALDRIDIPQTGIGVRRNGAPGAAPETDVGRTSRRVNGFGVSAGFQTRIGNDFILRLGGSYGEGTARETFSSPATSAAQRVDTGIVFGRLSNGSSGIIAGGGGDGDSRSQLSLASVNAEAMGFRVPIPSGQILIGTGVDYERTNTRHDLSFASSVVSGGTTFNFAQTREHRLREDMFGVYGKAEGRVRLSGGDPDDREANFAEAFASMYGGVYRRETQFRGTERDTANFGPNRDVTLTFAEDKGGWGGHLGAKVGVELGLTADLKLTVGGGVDYRSDVGAVVAPNSGDQVFFQGQTIRLESGSRTTTHADVGINFSF